MIENTILTGVMTLIIVMGALWLAFYGEILFYVLKQPKIEGIYQLKYNGNYTNVKVTKVEGTKVHYAIIEYNTQKCSYNSFLHYSSFLALYKRIG